MNKKEKYIEFIVKDLIKNVEFDFDRWTYKHPFGVRFSLPLKRKDININFAYANMGLEKPETSYFAKYVLNRYGVHNEELFKILVDYFNGIIAVMEEKLWNE